jgi:hypothetical protein
VRLVGGLTALTGATLGVAVARGKQTPETKTLAVGSSLVFGLADVHAARTQSRIYFGDALAQTIFAPAWLASWDGSAHPAGARRPRFFALRRPDDAAIRERVQTYGFLPEDVDIEVEGGVVTLRGAVEDERMATELVERIARARGVRGVDPRLAIGG